MRKQMMTLAILALLGGAVSAQDWTYYDVNRDGRLDQHEWQRMQWTNQNRGAWQNFDSNRNGFLDEWERQQMLQSWLNWHGDRNDKAWEKQQKRQQKAWEKQQKAQEKAWERQQKAAEKQRKQWEKSRDWDD